jgi:hypothetical protein
LKIRYARGRGLLAGDNGTANSTLDSSLSSNHY